MQHSPQPLISRLWIAFFICSLITISLPAQNRDSLMAAYMEAKLSKKTVQMNTCAEGLGAYYEKEGETDSSVKYYNITYVNSQLAKQKANAAFHIARSRMFSTPAITVSIAHKGYLLVQNDTIIERGNLCNILGIYYSLNGKYDSSLYYYTIALATSKAVKDETLLFKVNANLGDLYSYKGQYSIALKYQLESLASSEKRKDSINIIKGTVNVGNTYSNMESDSIAMTYYMRVYPLLKEKVSRLSGNLFNSMAVVYGNMSDKKKEGSPEWKTLIDKEKLLFEQSLNVKVGLADSLGISNVYINMGNMESKKFKDQDAALDYFDKARVISEKLNLTRNIRMIDISMGEIYVIKKAYAKAETHFLSALALSERDQDYMQQENTLGRLYRMFDTIGDYKQAYDYLKRYNQVGDIIRDSSYTKQLAEAETKYQSQKKEIENAALQFENEKRTIEKKKAETESRLTLIFSLGGLVLMAFIFFLVNRNIRIRSKAEEEQKVIKAIYESEQKERIRISRDLHDNVGTQLSLISNDIEWIAHPLKELTEAEKAGKLNVVSAMAKEVISELRETIWALNKEEVSFEEFADKLKTYVQKQSKTGSGMNPVFIEKLENPIMLGPSEALGLFRICQEAITNSLKYSGSAELQISLSAKDEKYSVIISDKGKGFDQEQKDGALHYGLENMKFRAGEISCDFELTSSLGEGTVIAVTKK